MGRKIAVALALLALPIAWCMRPFDPDAWRTFARETKDDAQLRELYADDDWPRTVDRWHRYLEALRTGDDEAFELAKRLCAVIRGSAHPSEEYYGALGWTLERRPAEVLQLTKTCSPSYPSLVCIPFDHDTEWEHLKASFDRRRIAVEGLLDGGLSEIATACLEDLRESP